MKESYGQQYYYSLLVLSVGSERYPVYFSFPPGRRGHRHIIATIEAASLWGFQLLAGSRLDCHWMVTAVQRERAREEGEAVLERAALFSLSIIIGLVRRRRKYCIGFPAASSILVTSRVRT